MDIQNLLVDDAFSLNLFGFQIDQGPPSPQGREQFAPSPTEKGYLGAPSSTEVPTQMIGSPIIRTQYPASANADSTIQAVRPQGGVGENPARQ